MVSLGSENLVVVAAELQARVCPGVEVVLHGDCRRGKEGREVLAFVSCGVL